MRPFEVRDDLRSVEPYRVPQADAPVRLNTNESPWPPPEAFVAALEGRVRGLDLNRYPDRDARALRDGLGARHGWPSDGVWVANGSNEIIQTLLLAFGGAGRRAVVFEPTYGMHSHIARTTATEVVSRRLDEPWALDEGTVTETLAAGRPAVTFVCSPNNPTGMVHPTPVVEAALAATDGLVVVDEAYGEFARGSATTLLAANDRLAVVRSFSKSWRLAGARIGVLLAHPWLVEAIQVARLPYHLSSLTQACGEVALAKADVMLTHIEQIVAERERLAKELERLVEVFPSEANFLLFRTPRDGTALWEALAAQGVLVRDLSRLIARALRVTVGTPEQNDAFLDALRRVLDGD